jgi:tetratricopeptide (TPR) repeat protein
MARLLRRCTRGLYLASIERRAQAIAHLRESARLATQAGDNFTLGRALGNLSYALSATDPAAAADAARSAVVPFRRVGNQVFLAYAIGNLAVALVELGDWDAAEAEFAQAVDSGGLADIEYLACERGRLAALRGDTMTAETLLAGLQDLRASEDPQEKAVISIVEAFTAAARRQPQDALRHARAVLAHADAVGISSDSPRWAWPLAARAAFELQEIAVTRDLLALLDSYQPGYLVPMLRAERDLARVRLADHDGDQAAEVAFTAAISSLRELSTPYHLAGGLLDHAEYLTRHGDAAAAAQATGEARDIARRLRCQPLLDRVADMTAAESRMRT